MQACFSYKQQLVLISMCLQQTTMKALMMFVIAAWPGPGAQDQGNYGSVY
jgi:hypothetical protein